MAKTFAIQQQTQAVKAEIATAGSATQIIEQLKAKVDANPEDPRGWYLLGRLYFSNGEFQQAIASYQKANKLKPKTPEVMTSMAESEFFLNNRKLPENAMKMLQEVLKQNPNYISALNLLGVNAFTNKEYQLAINYWQKIIPLLPPEIKRFNNGTKASITNPTTKANAV